MGDPQNAAGFLPNGYSGHQRHDKQSNPRRASPQDAHLALLVDSRSPS
jgi:hypothetical protein